MKVLHLSKYYKPYKGGIEQVVQDLCEASAKHGVISSVLCVNHEDFNNVSNIDGITVYRCKNQIVMSSAPVSIDYLLTFRRIIHEYDIIHVHLPNPLASLALLLTNLKGKKVVLHWHSDIVKQNILKYFYSPIQSWTLRIADSIIATSKIYAEQSDILPFYSSKVSVIPIGIEPLVPCPQITKSLIQDYNGRKIVFALGRHVYYKGFEYLIDAMRYLDDEYLLLIGGVGELTDNYIGLVSEYNLKDKVKFLGRIPEEKISSYFQAANVFCLPSIERSEAFGVVQIESFSVGTPVVSTSIERSGVSWVNANSISGLVVPPRDSKSLANAIIECCTDLNEACSQGALSRFEKFFHKDIMVKNTVKLYNDVLKDLK